MQATWHKQATGVCHKVFLPHRRMSQDVYETLELEDVAVTIKYYKPRLSKRSFKMLLSQRSLCYKGVSVTSVVGWSMLRDAKVTMKYVTRCFFHREVTRCLCPNEICYKTFLPQRRRAKYVTRFFHHGGVCYKMSLSRWSCKMLLSRWRVTRCSVTEKLQDVSATTKYVTKCFCHSVMERSMLQNVSVTMKYVTRCFCHNEVARCSVTMKGYKMFLSQWSYKSFLSRRSVMRDVSVTTEWGEVWYNDLM